MANEFTKNYNLDLYTIDDKPNLLEQYNGAINKIDEELHNNSVNITTANNTANRAYDVASEAKTTATDATKNANTAISTANSATKTANTASSTASSAVTTANSAKEIANAASATATSAATTANSANGKVDDALVKINDATTKIRTDFAAADTQIRTDFAAADAALDARIAGLSPVINARSPKRTGKKFLFFGDSWGQMVDQALYHMVVEYNDFAFSKNFSVNGAKLEDLNKQVDSATADTSFVNSDIDVIYVVCGTNNVFFNNPVSFEDALIPGNYMRKAFPNAEIHYFPNIARVYVNRSGRNTYMAMINGFCYQSNIIAHTQQMSLLAHESYLSYAGTDKYGVQHLTATGCGNFAFWISTLANGGDFDNYKIVAKIPMQFTSESSVTGDLTVHTFYGTPNSGAILIHAENLAWTSGHSESNPGKFQLEIPQTGESSFIVLPKFGASGGVGFFNTFTTAAYITKNDGTLINMPIRNITPKTADIYLPLTSLLSWD